MMEDAGARLRSIVREELEGLLREMERREAQEGHGASAPRPLTRLFGWTTAMAGALLLGLLCGILSHAAVVLLARALG